jgi:hypothetical protein
MKAESGAVPATGLLTAAEICVVETAGELCAPNFGLVTGTPKMRFAV